MYPHCGLPLQRTPIIGKLSHSPPIRLHLLIGQTNLVRPTLFHIPQTKQHALDHGMQGDACPAYSHTLLRPHVLLNKLHNFCVLRLISGKQPSPR